MPSEVYLFKQDEFFHTFSSTKLTKIDFNDFNRLFEDFLVYIQMKKHESSGNKENNDFNFDLNFGDLI